MGSCSIVLVFRSGPEVLSVEVKLRMSTAAGLREIRVGETGFCYQARSDVVMDTDFMVFVIPGTAFLLYLIQTLRTKLGFTDQSGFLLRCPLVLFLFYLPRELFLRRLQFV
jgi:hypothetical protein